MEVIPGAVQLVPWLPAQSSTLVLTDRHAPLVRLSERNTGHGPCLTTLLLVVRRVQLLFIILNAKSNR